MAVLLTHLHRKPMLGHANIQTTQKVYAKILDKTMDKAFNGLEKRMGIKT